MGRKSDFNKPPPRNGGGDQPKTAHFSHPHALTLVNAAKNHHQAPPTPGGGLTACAGCKLKPSGSIYCCSPCNFFLHRKCLQMPKTINHPAHQSHAFSLLAKPAYAAGGFICDACHAPGDGFSYHCAPCAADLHILCAVMPQAITHAGHSHELQMAYECPYYTKSFICDICKSPGSNHWLYRCSACGFDAHLKCATGGGGPPPLQNGPNSVDGGLSALFAGLGTNNNSSTPLTSYNQILMNNQGFGGQTPDAITSYNQILQQIMDQYKRGTENIPQGINQRSQETMAYIQQIIDQNKRGAGDVDAQQFVTYMNSLGAGGDGGVDFLQGMMSGGGGFDAANSLL